MYLDEELFQQGVVRLLVKFLSSQTDVVSWTVASVWTQSYWKEKKNIPFFLTGSKESSGRDPFRQFPVIFSSARVCTEKKDTTTMQEKYYNNNTHNYYLTINKNSQKYGQIYRNPLTALFMLTNK